MIRGVVRRRIAGEIADSFQSPAVNRAVIPPFKESVPYEPTDDDFPDYFFKTDEEIKQIKEKMGILAVEGWKNE